jgi:hypothetical protein
MREAGHQHVLPVAGRIHPHAIGAVGVGAAIGDVLRRARIAAHALIEAVMVEAVAPRHVAGVAGGGAVERGGLLERRQLVLGAEGIDVEGQRGAQRREHGGEAEAQGNAGAHRKGLLPPRGSMPRVRGLSKRVGVEWVASGGEGGKVESDFGGGV